MTQYAIVTMNAHHFISVGIRIVLMHQLILKDAYKCTANH